MEREGESERAREREGDRERATLLVTVLIASVGEALPEIIHSIPKDSDSRLYGVEACRGERERRSSGGRVLGRETQKKRLAIIQRSNTGDPTSGRNVVCVCV